MQKIHLGSRIKDFIEKSNIPKIKVAQDLGMTENNLYKICKKENVDTEILFQLSDILDIPFLQFFNENISDVEIKPIKFERQKKQNSSDALSLALSELETYKTREKWYQETLAEKDKLLAK